MKSVVLAGGLCAHIFEEADPKPKFEWVSEE